MEHGLSKEKIEEFKEVFDFFDKNKNGKICVSELSALMNTLGHSPTDDELELMIEEMDLNIDGVVDFDEFLVLMIKKMQEPLTREEEYKAAFLVFDKTGSGSGIRKEDLKSVLIDLGENIDDKKIDCIFKEGDTDKDGLINYQEFKQLLCDLEIK